MNIRVCDLQSTPHRHQYINLISQSYYNINISAQGFLSGKKKEAIPWGTLVRDPSSWITEACMSDDFEWKDPSKIQIGEIFHLLDHWRDQQDQGLDPIIWVPTCSLLQYPTCHMIMLRTFTQLFLDLEKNLMKYSASHIVKILMRTMLVHMMMSHQTDLHLTSEIL
jgi:hypothetical protein